MGLVSWFCLGETFGAVLTPVKIPQLEVRKRPFSLKKSLGGGEGRGGGATRTRGKVNTSPAPHPLYLPFVTIFSVLIAEEALISKAEGRFLFRPVPWTDLFMIR